MERVDSRRRKIWGEGCNCLRVDPPEIPKGGTLQSGITEVSGAA